ncbi:polysaccharide biosynthesis/export family protein [Methylophaga sp.]|uniref:polysaccharide biosynthesis/export family protein n=1 Tax=Methylophaga sp. TaxID=2024840 RepID=UPI003A959058
MKETAPMKILPLTIVLLIALAGSGCAAPGLSNNRDESSINGSHWIRHSSDHSAGPAHYLGPRDAYIAYDHAPEDLLVTTNRIAAVTSRLTAGLPVSPPLSPGDRIRIDLPPKGFFHGVFETTDAALAGVYEVDFDGTLKLPYLTPIQVAGLPLAYAETEVNEALEASGYFKRGMAALNISIQQWAPIQVSVAGAVFAPGRVAVNPRAPELTGQQLMLRGGSTSLNRFMSTALLAAGGVRPDADVQKIELIRGGVVYPIDLSGAVAGHHIEDVALIQGDQIRVPSLGLPDARIIRPTSITPPGIRVFISNLTVPALNNASSAIGRHATSLPYGSQLHTAVVSGNCAGGAASTNSDRYAVLVTTDPVTRRPITVERRIEQVLSQPGSRSVNPYLMPNDSVVCYDSEVSNLRDIARTISDVLSPIGLLFR